MAIRYTDEAPRRLQVFKTPPSVRDSTDELENRLGEVEVTQLAEIFNTPLTGAYNWDYRLADDRISKLYELGKRLNWNATLDVHWERTPDWHVAPPVDAARRQDILAGSPWIG